MNILSILKLAQKALSAYNKLSKGNKVARRILRYGGAKYLLKSVVSKSLGGYDVFDGYDFKKQKEPIEKKSHYVPRERKVKEYAINKMWKSLSEAQKKQFREWFRKKALSQSRVARSFTLENELRKIQSRVTRISNKYFLGKKKLSKQEWEFVANFSEFFGELDNKKAAKPLNVKHGGNGWYVTKSSWLLRFKYEGKKGKNEKGNLAVIMIRGNGKIYNFPAFPYMEYVLLKNCSGSIGKYWWKQWLWRYSTNPTKWNKYWYKGRKR